MSDTTLEETDSLADLDQQSLLTAVAELLEGHGWQTELPLELSGGDAVRLATRDGESQLIRAIPAEGGPVTGSTVTAALEAADEAGATGLILIAVADVTDVAQEQAERSDRITLVDVDTAEGLADTLATVCRFDAADERSGEAAASQNGSGATPDMVEAAVADVAGDEDEETGGDEAESHGPADERSDAGSASDERPGGTGATGEQSGVTGATDEQPGSSSTDDVAGSVRGIEPSVALGELLLQTLLLLGLVLCVAYLALRFGQVLL